jgi:redox-sensitive bicupin YhaK (pirin superfamily)
MKSIIYKADTRGIAEHGWLTSYHTFSFGSYFEPSRVRFGLLRVLNDDFVIPGKGFGTHPHVNMEIISIPPEGSLEHRDDLGTSDVIRVGEVQIMSAGSGITHSEFNHSDLESVNFLQLWILTKVKDIKPRYGKRMFDLENSPYPFVNCKYCIPRSFR